MHGEARGMAQRDVREIGGPARRRSGRVPADVGGWTPDCSASASREVDVAEGRERRGIRCKIAPSRARPTSRAVAPKGSFASASPKRGSDGCSWSTKN